MSRSLGMTAALLAALGALQPPDRGLEFEITLPPEPAFPPLHELLRVPEGLPAPNRKTTSRPKAKAARKARRITRRHA